MIYNNKKHIEVSNAFSTSRSISSYGKVNSLITSAAEQAISLFIAIHCSILTSDHLGELCQKYFKESDAVLYMKLHRSKCTVIISNVLGPHFAQCLKENIGDSYYSILVKSTDIREF